MLSFNSLPYNICQPGPSADGPSSLQIAAADGLHHRYADTCRGSGSVTGPNPGQWACHN